MTVHEEIIQKLKNDFIKDLTIESMFVIGSVARNTYTESSDLDIVLILKEAKDHKYTDQLINGVAVEIQSNTLENYLKWLEERPFRIYAFEDVVIIFDRASNLNKLQNKAMAVKDNYKPDDNTHLKHWLQSVCIKIKSAECKNDYLLIGYLISNVLGKIIQALYNINYLPTPASTQAYEKITNLKILPDDFRETWKNILIGNLEQKKEATLRLLNYCIQKLV